jgi:hypothetical protein
MICAVCFGDPTSLMTKGYNLGILTLLGVIGAMMLVFALFFINIYKRNRRGSSC